MSSQSFVLELLGPNELSDETLSHLHGFGCSDASFGSRAGRLYADFDRESPTLRQALASAIAQVERVPSLRVLRIAEQELVGLPQIAARTGRTRQNIWQLARGERGAGNFPAPAVQIGADRALWRWSEVEDWLVARDSLPHRRLSEDRALIAQVNSLLEVRNRLSEGSLREAKMVGSYATAVRVTTTIASTGPTETSSEDHLLVIAGRNVRAA